MTVGALGGLNLKQIRKTVIGLVANHFSIFFEQRTVSSMGGKPGL